MESEHFEEKKGSGDGIKGESTQEEVVIEKESPQPEPEEENPQSPIPEIKIKEPDSPQSPELDNNSPEIPLEEEEEEEEVSQATSTIPMEDELDPEVLVIEKDVKTKEEMPAKLGAFRKAGNECLDYFAHDRVSGSIIGPNPPNLICLCPAALCLSGSEPRFVKKPFETYSFSTKMMYFCVFGIIVILATFCLFIPSPGIEYMCGQLKRTQSEFIPICEKNLGYFMTYRVFFAFALFCALMGLVLINVKSAGVSNIRSKIHYGFWLYKFSLLTVLLILTFLVIPLGESFAFEYVLMTFGFVAFFIFSLAQLTFILDLIEVLLVNLHERGLGKSYKCIYWFLTHLTYFIDCLLIVILILCYGSTSNFGQGSTLCVQNIIFISYDLFCGIALTVFGITSLAKARFENTGLLQTSIVILHTIFLTWSAMENDPKIECRPAPISYTFTPQGFTHGLLTILSLVYFIIFNGPRTDSAPLSRAFNKIMYRFTPKPKHYEDLTCKGGQQGHDDETGSVMYSWPLFYLSLILGSLTLMMSMTNFSDPGRDLYFTQAQDETNSNTTYLPVSSNANYTTTSSPSLQRNLENYHLNASYFALSIKMILSLVSILVFLWPQILPIKWIYPECNLQIAPESD